MATTQDLFLLTSTLEYTYEYYDEFCDKNVIQHFGAIFTLVFFSIVVTLSLFGNILIIVILAKFENVRSLTNTFILNLAVSDLFFTIGLPFWAYYHMYGWTLGVAACKLVAFIFDTGFYSSGILLILMTVHRYIAIVHPLSNLMSAVGSYSVLTSVVIWVLSLLAASPALISTNVQDEECMRDSSYWISWGTYQQNILFTISLVVFLFCYSQIICRLLRPTAQKRRSKTLRLIFILVVVFFLGWAPYNIVTFIQSFNPPPKTSEDSSVLRRHCEISKLLEYAVCICRFFAFSHCFLNPIFYVFVGVKFKNHLKNMLKTWGSINRSSSIRSRRTQRNTITSITSIEEFL